MAQLILIFSIQEIVKEEKEKNEAISLYLKDFDYTGYLWYYKA